MRGAGDRGLSTPDVEIGGAPREIVGAAAQEKEPIAALRQFARDRATDAFGGSK